MAATEVKVIAIADRSADKKRSFVFEFYLFLCGFKFEKGLESLNGLRCNLNENSHGPQVMNPDIFVFYCWSKPHDSCITALFNSQY